MRTEHIYIPSWERFAGKPYVKPGKNTGLRTRKTGVIAGTVKDAQELLCGLFVKHEPRDIKTVYVDDLFVSKSQWVVVSNNVDTTFYRPSSRRPGTSYPQSLGELCIELAQEKILKRTNNPVREIMMLDCGWITGVPRDLGRRDIQNLRTRMYHKHTDPYEEKLYQLAETLRRL